MNDLKIGDRVKAIREYAWNKEIVGEIGTVNYISNDKTGVTIEFDKDICGHDGLYGKMGHCWWIPCYLISEQGIKKC